MLSSGLIIHAEYLAIEVVKLPGRPQVLQENSSLFGGRHYTSGSGELHLFISDCGLLPF